MSLVFTLMMEKLKLSKNWVGLLAVVLGLAVFGSQAIAQDMSFDLNEVEAEGEAGAEAEGGADMEFGVGEAEEGSGEAEAGAGAEASAEGGGDVFAELTAGDDDVTEGADENVPRVSELAEEIYAVQRMYVLRNGRLELSPSFAQTVNDQYVTHPALSAGLNYWITNVLAVGANFLWYQGSENESDLNFSIRRSTRLAVPITEYQLGAYLNFTYVPIYGKFTMFNDAIFQWDSYIVGGVGMMRTRPVAVIDPAVRSFNFDLRVAFNAGIGIRIFLTRWLTIFGELRDYMYLEKLENLNVQLPCRNGATTNCREDENTWIDKNATFTNNVTVHVGATIFIPFTFDYEYPK